jgi:phospholipid/cholesterol/gamma-HCH transport system substrate-binding protein
METRAHHILIGLFTVIVVAAALLFAMWLVRSTSDRKFNEAVTGLTRGGTVQYNGIKVGTIARLQLDPTDPRRVIARIHTGSDVPIKEDTHAKLALTGVTGVAVIQLSGGSPPSRPLVSADGNVPRIIADPSPFAKLLTNGEDLVTNISQAALRASELLSPENIGRIERTLDHLDKATGTIAEQREDIRTLIQQLALASKQANATLVETQALIHNANGLVQGDGRQTLNSARNAMASLERVTASVDRLLNSNHDAIDGGAQSLNDLGPAIRELRETLSSLHKITRELDENPTRYLLGRDKTKEFVP